MWLWRPEGGLIRRGWDRGGLRRRAVAVSTTLGLLVALGGWVSMVPPVFVAGLVLAAPGMIILSVRGADHPDRTAGA
ncbi:MAG TPA: hypothetical protein VE198_01095 [Actinoallomurus sp.]|nr:hypothetical protein [Actinoallomurus sp.]